MRMPQHITSPLLILWLFWSSATATPTRPPRQPHESSASHSDHRWPGHSRSPLTQQYVGSSSSPFTPESNAAGHSVVAPDAGKGKSLLNPPSLIYNQQAGRLVRGHTSHARSSRPLQAPPFDLSKARRIDRPLEQSWKDDFPGQVMAMGETISRHTGKSLTTCHRLLSKYGNHEIAHGLASGNEELQLQAIAKLPFTTKGRRARTESARTLYFGDQAEEITEKYRKMYDLTRKQATDKLRHSLTSSTAKLMMDPATFEQGARKLRFSASLSKIKLGKSRASQAVKKPPAVPAEEDNAAENGRLLQPLVPKTSTHMLPGLLHQEQHKPSHVIPLSKAGPSSQPPLHEKDPDDIDFDAVMEWVNRGHPKGGTI